MTDQNTPAKELHEAVAGMVKGWINANQINLHAAIWPKADAQLRLSLDIMQAIAPFVAGGEDKEAEIDESCLLLLGFTLASDEFGKREYHFPCGIEDPSPNEQAVIRVRRGNGFDPACWDIRFFTHRGEMSGGIIITLKYGARKISEIVHLIKALHFDAARAATTPSKGREK